MKGSPLVWVSGQGYVDATVETATHLTIRFPGPVGELTLPVMIGGTRKGTGNWTWNGSTDSPTLRPSVKTEGNDFLGGDATDKTNWVPYLCHTWVTDGKAQFLDDTTHSLRGQTVDLLEV